jgi:hypothetical protein
MVPAQTAPVAHIEPEQQGWFGMPHAMHIPWEQNAFEQAWQRTPCVPHELSLSPLLHSF